MYTYYVVLYPPKRTSSQGENRNFPIKSQTSPAWKHQDDTGRMLPVVAPLLMLCVPCEPWSDSVTGPQTPCLSEWEW